MRPTAPNKSEHSMVPELRGRLATHLAEIEAEAQLIRKAMAALDRKDVGSLDGSVSRAASTTALRVVHALRDSPGARASMVALTTGLSSANVRSVLVDLEGAGKAKRAGLGWSLVPG